jgi:hypothetical protein
MNDSGKQHDADRLDALVREFTGDYNEPPGDLDERSREEIFQRVQRVRGRHRRAPAPRPHRRLWMQAAGIAAVLLVGIAIGRWDPPARPGNGDGPVATNGTEELSRRSVYRFAARAYLERTENLLGYGYRRTDRPLGPRPAARNASAPGQPGGAGRCPALPAARRPRTPAGPDCPGRERGRRTRPVPNHRSHRAPTGARRNRTLVGDQ